MQQTEQDPPHMRLKLFVPLEDVTRIVAAHLREKGLNVINGMPQTHVEGEFDESRDVLDGLAFELDILA